MKNKIDINSSINELNETSSFISRHIGSSDDQVNDCLGFLNYKSLDQLVMDTLPNQIVLDVDVDLKESMSEDEALKYLQSIVSKNKLYKNYIGMGYYDTKTPSVVLRNILENPGWYTAYTPYQPEVSQGRLEMLLNFQQMIMDLTGLEVSNASLLDEGTAAVESMLVAFRFCKDNKNVFLVSENCHIQTIKLLETRAEPLGIEIKIGNLESLFKENEDNFFGFISQYPDTLGSVRDHDFLISTAKSQNAVSILACDLMSLLLLKSPGEMGCDMAVGSSQRFGVPLGFGGPHAAFISCKDEFKRLLPGRIIGISIDKNSDVAYRMALQTREQHIRREKATSNICTCLLYTSDAADE